MENCNVVAIPIDPNISLERNSSNENIIVNRKSYRQLIDLLTYAAYSIRADLSCTINFMNRFQSLITEKEWCMLKEFFVILNKLLM